jgi:8-amino-7-oxononanoate synthase
MGTATLSATTPSQRTISPPLMESPPGPETVIDGVRYLYFAGTSYHGLHGHPEVIEAGCGALRKFGVHTATSRAGFGNSPLVLAVERSAAEFFGAEAAFYFTSGYSANHIAVQALAAGVDAVFVDAEAHYCLREAALVAGKPVVTFKHRDAADLRSKLRPGVRPLVMADGVVPSSGHMAPVAAYLEVLSDFGPAVLHLDDAHGVGVLGAGGRGIFEHCGLWSGVNGGPPREGVMLSMCGTLAKALGGFGGIIPGTADFVNRVRKASHYYDGASAPPAPIAGCTLKALEICRREPERRMRLRENVRQLREGLRSLGIVASDEPTPNVGAVIRDAATMQRLHAVLKAQGILVPYVPAYSGAGPEGLMRFAVCSGHTPEMIARLLGAVDEFLKTTGTSHEPVPQ